MTQLAIYLDTDTAHLLGEAAKQDGVSRSAWVRQAIQSQLRNRLPDSFFDVLGTWEDDRQPDDIVKSFRDGAVESTRAPLE
jgi:hypothetical protein